MFVAARESILRYRGLGCTKLCKKCDQLVCIWALTSAGFVFKPLLECERCQNCYHPPCLGPNYPKPNKKSCKKSWVSRYPFIQNLILGMYLQFCIWMIFFFVRSLQLQVCMTCIRCKSCGVTPGKSWDTEWNHDKGLCPDCTKLYDQGEHTGPARHLTRGLHIFQFYPVHITCI